MGSVCSIIKAESDRFSPLVNVESRREGLFLAQLGEGSGSDKIMEFLFGFEALVTIGVDSAS